jgi:predicted nucleotidyltransferase component of viral defense system
MYRIFDRAVLHGGTAIWRCYRGNRFSEDIDVYIIKDVEKINMLFENFEKRGFIIKKKKIGENSLYSILEINRTVIRFEALFKHIRGILKEYETADGNLLTIYALAPEELAKEKINAYLKRTKIRDLYDVFFLLRYIPDKNKIKNQLKNLTCNFEKPADEKELKVIILEGITPASDEMLEYIKRQL